MAAVLPPLPLLLAFLAASLILAVTPGPGVMYIVARSVSHGRRSGLASVAGVAAGNLINAVGASMGLAALFALSSLAFTAVKYAGAAYLVYLGVQALRSSARPTSSPAPAPAAKVFRDGLIVAALNPKTTLFFAAFLPQFTQGAGTALQSIALGILFVAIAAVTDSVYALVAGSTAPRFARATSSRVLARYASGSTFIGLGVLSALSDGGRQ